MYEKTDWKARKGTNLNRFKKSQETDKSVILENAPTSVTEPGTSFNTANMNKIEDGIFETHEMIAREAQTRENAISEEAQTRENAINEEAQTRENAINEEAQTRENAINEEVQIRAAAINEKAQTRQDQVNQINNTLEGVRTLTLLGAFLTRVINGTTEVAKILFPLYPYTVFINNKTLISDPNGTVGVCREINNATITVETISLSPISPSEPTLLGNVNTFADLPKTIEEAVMSSWNTPRVDDYARVLRDETNSDSTTE